MKKVLATIRCVSPKISAHTKNDYISFKVLFILFLFLILIVKQDTQEEDTDDASIYPKIMKLRPKEQDSD